MMICRPQGILGRDRYRYGSQVKKGVRKAAGAKEA